MSSRRAGCGPGCHFVGSVGVHCWNEIGHGAGALSGGSGHVSVIVGDAGLVESPTLPDKKDQDQVSIICTTLRGDASCRRSCW